MLLLVTLLTSSVLGASQVLNTQDMPFGTLGEPGWCQQCELLGGSAEDQLWAAEFG